MLSENIVSRLTNILSTAKEREICGFLLTGSAGEQTYFGVFNLARLPWTFLVSHTDVERVARFAKSHGMRIAAFIHSHNGSLDLSDDDRLAMCASGLPWIVVTLSEGKLRMRVYEHEAR